MVNTKKFNSILLAIIITVASGCAGMKSRDAVSGSAGIGLGASQGSGPFDETKPSDSTVETPAPADEKKVAVVLGPGGYKAFAHTGVLKALGKNNIPIHAIVGIEWGSLVAGLYAQ